MLRREREEYERELAAMKSSLTPHELDKLWAEGYAMSTDSVVTLALEARESSGE
jgi:hypothetical protein